jgi:2-polyprenyl-3-methyl-5-hydroxy-6-metoxy-1,4-benzoquinol methylase
MLSLEAFQKSYETDTAEVLIRGRRFRLFLPKSIDRFIDDHDVLYRFPLWSKVWEASLILADELAGMPVRPEKTFLEIGCGLGLVGVVAASFGHQITMTENDPHALAFARANAWLNGCSNVRILSFDWNKPEMDGVFDVIVGSEVIYHERDFEPLQEVFQKFLKPGGEVILCAEMRRTNMAFFSLMQESYEIKGRKKTLRSEEKNISLILCSMSPKR